VTNDYPVVERLRGLMGNATREHMKDYERTAADAIDRILMLQAALSAIFLAADNAGNEQEWADMVSAEMTDERRALVSKD